MLAPDLINQLIPFFQYCETQYGKSIFIKEYLTTRRDNYDRHCTTYSNFDFKLESFGVRTSGAKAMFAGAKFSYEISTGNLISFEENTEEEYLLVENYSEAIYRLSVIKFL